MNGEPAEWADPIKLANWLGYGVDAELLGRIGAVPRLAVQIQMLIGARLGVASASAVQVRALALDPIGLAGLAHQAGLVWHVRAVLAVIGGTEVRSLILKIGAGGRTLAIRYAALGPSMLPLVPATELPQAIRADGPACLAAWGELQPEAVGRRITLRLAGQPVLSPLHRTHGPQIIEALLGNDP